MQQLQPEMSIGLDAPTTDLPNHMTSYPGSKAPKSFFSNWAKRRPELGQIYQQVFPCGYSIGAGRVL